MQRPTSRPLVGGAARGRGGALALALALASIAAPARAEAPRAGASAEDDARRLAELAALFEAEERAARTWRTGWMLTFAGLSLGQGAAALWFPDHGTRVDAGVGAVKSTLGFLGTLVRPFAPLSLHQELAALPERTPAERRAKRRRAEELLREGRRDEAFGVGWAPRVAAGVVNLAGTTWMWARHERFVSGWLALGAGMVVSELQVQTQPTGLLAVTRVELAAHPTPGGAALTLRGVF